MKSSIVILCMFALVCVGCKSCLSSDEQKLPGGFVFNSQRKDIIGKFDIPPSVKSFECKENFIFVVQSPRYPIDAIYDIDYYDYSSNDSILFWIIDTKRQKIIGPVESILFNRCKDSIFHQSRNLI